METTQNQKSIHAYETPAVTYEATLVAHAGVSSVFPCTSPPGDLLDPTKGN
jgi:hypothetical protein